MPTTSTFWTGPNLGTFSLTPQDVSTAGVLTDNALGIKSMTGQWRSLRIEVENQLVELSAADSTRLNNVKIKDGVRVTLTVMIDQQLTKNLLKDVIAASAYQKLILLQGTAGSDQETIYGVVSSFNQDFSAEEGTAELVMESLDPEGPNPLYS